MFDGNHILISDVVVNDHQVRLILDTGASLTILNPKTAIACKSQKLAGTLKSNNFGEIFDAEPVTVSTLKLGQIVLRDLPGIVTNSEWIGQGLIGGLAFERMAVTIDYHSKTLTLAKAASSGKSAFVVPMILIDSVPYVRLRANGKSLGLFAIDTGSYCSIISRDQIDDESIYYGEKILSLSGTTYLRGSTVLRNLELGDLQIEEMPFSVCSNQISAGVLGCDFLSHYSVTIDYPNRRLMLEPR
jgi:predicted aspartyl protease